MKPWSHRMVRWAAPLLLVSALLAGAAAPAAAQPLSDYLTLNENGGRTETDGLRITVGKSRYQVERNGKYQIYNEGVENGTLSWIVVISWDAGITDSINYDAGVMCYGSENVSNQWGCNVNDPETTPFDTSLDQIWDDHELTQSGNNPFTATMDFTEEWSPVLAGESMNCPFKVYTDITYTSPNPYADVSARIDLQEDSTTDCDVIDSVQIYLAADMYLDGEDNGPSRMTEYEGARVIAQFNETGVGGFRDVGTPWTSYSAAAFPCLFGATESDALGDTDFTCDVAGFNSGNARGIYYGEPYPNIVEGEATDAGVGVHWDITANPEQKVSTQIFFAPASLFGSDEEDVEAAECDLTPDMAVSPQFINLAPGGTATVEVAMRNLCNDRPYRNSDLLVSFSDSLRVIGGSDGMVNLGQRAAWQGFTLNPAETRRWTVTVQADGTLLVAPVHISELYHLGRVASRIDGVFITPAPAPAPESAPAPAPEPAPIVVAEPVLLPVTLPNTAGGLGLAGLLIGAVGAAGLMLIGRRITR